MCWSFTLHFQNKSKASIVIYETLTNLSDSLKLYTHKLPAQARTLSLQNTVISKCSDLCSPSASTFFKLSNALWSFLGIILKSSL